MLDGYLYAVGGQDGVSCLSVVERLVFFIFENVFGAQSEVVLSEEEFLFSSTEIEMNTSLVTPGNHTPCKRRLI